MNVADPSFVQTRFDTSDLFLIKSKMGLISSSEKPLDVRNQISWVPTDSVDTTSAKAVYLRATGSDELTRSILLDDITRLHVLTPEQLRMVKAYVNFEDDTYLQLPQVHIMNKACKVLITIVNDHSDVEPPSPDTTCTFIL